MGAPARWHASFKTSRSWSTARGIYALDAETGEERWVYPSELPLADTPTVYKGVLYIGGLDRRMHAIEAQTGQRIWTYTAGGGFSVSPLVVNNALYAGCRDGLLYALDAKTGALRWTYGTDAPIAYSAAYKDSTIYFASNDGRAYAVAAADGALVWKTPKLPGAGFHSFWPVIHEGYVIFSGSNNYRTSVGPGPTKQFSNGTEKEEVYLDYQKLPQRCRQAATKVGILCGAQRIPTVVDQGTTVGPEIAPPAGWPTEAQILDLSQPHVTSAGKTQAVTEYLENKPWRRTVFVFERATGQEVTTDVDGDGRPEYAPFLWFGTHSGNRYPPVVGADGLLHQSASFMSDSAIPGGHIVGWKVGAPYIAVPPGSGWNAADEPQGYAAGGRLVYWNRCCDRVGASFDPTRDSGGFKLFRSWIKTDGTFSTVSTMAGRCSFTA